MSEEWLEYLRENAPDLYEQAVASRKHDTEWRDNYIRDLEAQLARVRELPRYNFKPNTLFRVQSKGGKWIDVDELEAALKATGEGK